MAKSSTSSKPAEKIAWPWAGPLAHACILLVGLGAIGSHVAALLARLDQVAKIILVDFDSFDTPRNVMGQAIEVRHLGFKKAVAVAEIVRAIRPGLEVVVIDARMQEVPIGRLACDVIVSALDSKLARQYLNEVAYRLGGIPVVDAGVLASMALARVGVTLPGASNSCLECQFTTDDYRNLEIVFSCMGRREMPSTNSPAYLASLAASIQAGEVHKILLGRWDEALVGWELIVSACDHGRLLSRVPRNPACRFDHRVWRVEDGPSLSAAVADVFQASCVRSLSVPGGQFARALCCGSCGSRQPILRFVRDTVDLTRPCEKCACPMFVSALDWTGGLTAGKITGFENLSLGRIGLEEGDILILAQAQGMEIHRKIVT